MERRTQTMADKSKKQCQGKDTFERINFLYQAASQMTNKSHILSCYYGQQCRSISKKTLQRMEPEMKRTICKQCGLILKPGISAELSIANGKNEHRNECLIQCGKCNTSKRFNINPKYNLWIDTEQAISETICPGNQSIVPAKQQ